MALQLSPCPLEGRWSQIQMEVWQGKTAIVSIVRAGSCLGHANPRGDENYNSG